MPLEMDARIDPLNLPMQTRSLRQSVPPVFGIIHLTARPLLPQGIPDSSRRYRSMPPDHPVAYLLIQQAEVPRGQHTTRLNILSDLIPGLILLRVLHFHSKT